MNTIRETSSRIRSGELRPTDLVASMLEEIKKNNDADHAFITITEDMAHEQATLAEKEIASGVNRGPLHGIPYTAKDLFKTAGIRTTGGSRVFEDYIPDEDAEIVALLRERGSVLLGKVNLHELAHGAIGVNETYGTVPNLYDPTRISGGSSSGSAGAVARGYGLFSIGTDTGGSVRVPAALCGLVGLKPTYGLLSCDGVIPYCWSLDHVGPITRTACDCKIVMSALLAGNYDALEAADSLKGLRIGIPTTFFYENLDPEIAGAMDRVKEAFVSLGATLEAVEMPDLKQSRTASLLIQLPEILSYHSRYLADRGTRYSFDILAGMTAGQFILAEDYLAAKRTQNLYREEMKRVLREVDLLLTPATPCVAPKIDSSFVELGGKPVPVGNTVTMFFSFFNMTGNPAISVPAGFHSTGLPIGFQLVGRHFDEAGVLQAAMTYESRIGEVPGGV